MEAGRAPTQLGWYRFACRYVRDRTVLDVGCGLGNGLRILAGSAAGARGLDMDPRLAGADVMIMSISEVENKSFDVVLAIDVIEHVEHPLGFLSELARVARIGVFLTTPNWTASRNRWSYHLREYKPREFQELTKRIGHVTMFKGTQSGSEIHQVRNQQSYFLLNDLRTFIPTALLGRLVNLLLPGPCKIHSTLAAWCDIGGATETSS